MRFLVAAFAVFVLLPPRPLHAEVVVPSESCRGFFFVPVTLVSADDPGVERVLWFVHDTGASRSWVDPDSLERATGRRIAPGRRVNVRGASAGPVRYRRLPVTVRELDHLSLAMGREVDGILEFEAFGGRLIILDYAAGEIRLGEGSLPPPDRKRVFDASGRDERPWLEVRFPERTRRMLIDSGAADTGLVVRDLDDYATAAPPRPVATAMRLKEIQVRNGARLDGDARLGSHVLVRPTIEETDGTELIGGDVMRHFVWTFDARTDRVAIERIDERRPVTFEPLRGHGMVLVPDGKALRVHAVMEETPAERAGIRPGDRITHFDGRPIEDRGCARPADTVEVTLVRDGRVMRERLELFPLVE